MIEAKVILDSINEYGDRLTTMQISLPKVLLAELQTHRTFSRNFSSSRAIPVAKVNTLDSFVPAFYGKNQPGMTAKQEEIENKEEAERIWLETIEYCKKQSAKLNELGLHKQWSNRLNDWHVYATGIVSSTDYENFFKLRIHPDAQPEMRILAEKMKQAMDDSIPLIVYDGYWHLPYIIDTELGAYGLELCAKISAARCCRVSYLKHDGFPATVDEELALYKRLAESVPPHMSPLEHQATVCFEPSSLLKRNFDGWVQQRTMLELGIPVMR